MTAISWSCRPAAAQQRRRMAAPGHSLAAMRRTELTGTIVVGTGVCFDVRTIDFEWLLDELRARRTPANQAALDAILTTHDEHGMDMLIADELDSDGLNQLAIALDGVALGLDESAGGAAMASFIEEVCAAIRCDPRFLVR